ncbi:MAG: hypothetical protein KDJ28_11535 [Candidatus Competibacteraceae bacterium]|nr:hypothetical protein [Candidatus Competibacteraceae bacterium]
MQAPAGSAFRRDIVRRSDTTHHFLPSVSINAFDDVNAQEGHGAHDHTVVHQTTDELL